MLQRLNAGPALQGRPKTDALRAFTNHIVRDRWDELRPVTPQELAGTSVLVLPIEEASAKVRTGPPVDDEEDLGWPAWAGIVPLALGIGVPQPDAHVRAETPSLERSRVTRGTSVL